MNAHQRRAMRWWAVWDPEYPEHGSVHVRARNETEARRKAEGVFNDENEVDAGPVSDAVHRTWLADGEPTKTSCQRMGPKRVRLPGPRA
jgi:hypothetical protein